MASVRHFALMILAVFWGATAAAQQLERGAPDCSPEAVAETSAEAERGVPAAIYRMARYYSTGICVGGNGEKALALYARAAELRYPPAYYNLGVIAAAGQNYTLAEALFLQGTKLGHRGCELQLGILYSFPIPDVGDPIKAFAWLSLSAIRGGEFADTASPILVRLKSELKTRELRQAEALFLAIQESYAGLPEFQP